MNDPLSEYIASAPVERLTPERKAAIRARLQAATPKPWTNNLKKVDWFPVIDQGGRYLVWHAIGPAHCDKGISMDEGRARAMADSELIQNAPSDLALLLDETSRLEEKVVNLVERNNALCRTWVGPDEAAELRSALARQTAEIERLRQALDTYTRALNNAIQGDV